MAAESKLNRETLDQLAKGFDSFIAPLLSDGDVEDVNLAWEFQKFLHLKKLKLLTAEREAVKKWKELLSSR
ncbi:MAG: hypothetical protein LYZ66_04010 [Nitrososphaerales archaeon]|nr:hypothetical protein [Nitrososphaerales archaeon]